MYRIRLKSNAKASIFVVLAMLLFMGSTKAQDNSEKWTLLSEQTGVKVYYKISKCVDASLTDPAQMINASKKSTVFLKFENLDAASKSIEWKSQLNSESTTKLSTTLLSLSTSETTCENSSSFELKSNTNASNPGSISEALSLLNITIASN